MGNWLKAPFHFISTPVSVLAVLIYAIIFASVLYTDELYNVPKNTKGLDVDRAYADLHQVRAPGLLGCLRGPRALGQCLWPTVVKYRRPQTVPSKALDNRSHASLS